jgi:hypothetical protein
VRVFLFAQLVSKLFYCLDRDSIELLFSDCGQDLFVQPSSKIEGVRRSAIQLAPEPILCNLAEGWHLCGLDVVAARGLLRGIDLEPLGLFAGFETDSSSRPE